MENGIVCEICVVHGFNFLHMYWFCLCLEDIGKHANPQGWTTLYEPHTWQLGKFCQKWHTKNAIYCKMLLHMTD